MELVTEVSQERAAAVGAALREVNLRRSPELRAAKELYGAEEEPLEVYALPEGAGPDEELLGGLVGRTWLGWLHIDLLWVRDPGSGLGTRLVAAAERAARGRRCHGARVETWSFQAPGFYQRLGYRVVGEVPGSPAPGVSDLLLIKEL